MCTLLDKPSRRTHEVRAAYRGFDVPDVFVVGYGMDYDGAYRNLRRRSRARRRTEVVVELRSPRPSLTGPQDNLHQGKGAIE